MALADDLLEQARHLAEKERGKPSQASLRRALSAAYYALFHLLVEAGAGVLRDVRPVGLRFRVQRAFDHKAMRNVCIEFAAGQRSALKPAVRALIAEPLEAELASVARAFVDLQEIRRDADYDGAQTFRRAEVLENIDRAQQAFDDWRKVHRKDNATVFLTALLLARHWVR